MNEKPRKFVFTRTSRIFYTVIATSADEAGEILVHAMNEAEAYRTKVEVADPGFIYYGEIEL